MSLIRPSWLITLALFLAAILSYWLGFGAGGTFFLVLGLVLELGLLGRLLKSSKQNQFD